jgi:hypothetical protein
MNKKTIRKVGYRAWSKTGPVPFIPIQGKFLESLGFPVGGKCRITYAQDKIVITACQDPKAEA